jgi:histidinol phosphatase-like PHP family hydrolase
MIIDMHAHSSGISPCCRIPADKVIIACKERGLDGIILTNHYSKSYLLNGDANGFAREYVDEYRLAKKYGEEYGVRVFFGIEITMELYDRVHLLVYGVDCDFVLSHPDIYDYTQQELYKTVHEYGGALIQAHPMRRGKNVLLDLDFLDGVEINSHPIYDATHVDELSEIAAEKGLMITSGGDYHADTKRPFCGAELPEDIESTSIGKFLLTTDKLKIHYQEPRCDDLYSAVYQRGIGITNKF